MVRGSCIDSICGKFPEQPDIAKVAVYALSFLFAGMFLFVPFLNFLHLSPWHQWIGTIHSFGVLLATVVVETGRLAFPVLRGVRKVLQI